MKTSGILRSFWGHGANGGRSVRGDVLRCGEDRTEHEVGSGGCTTNRRRRVLGADDSRSSLGSSRAG